MLRRSRPALARAIIGTAPKIGKPPSVAVQKFAITNGLVGSELLNQATLAKLYLLVSL